MLIKDHHTYDKGVSSSMDLIDHAGYVSSPAVASLIINMIILHNIGEQIYICFLPTNYSALIIGVLHELHVEQTDRNYVYYSLSLDSYSRPSHQCTTEPLFINIMTKSPCCC